MSGKKGEPPPLPRRTLLYIIQEGECFWHQFGLCSYPENPIMELNYHKTTENGNVKENGRFASYEHLTRKSHGGKNNFGNVKLAHANCNHRREKRRKEYDKELKKFRRFLQESVAGF